MNPTICLRYLSSVLLLAVLGMNEKTDNVICRIDGFEKADHQQKLDQILGLNRSARLNEDIGLYDILIYEKKNGEGKGENIWTRKTFND